MLNKHCVVSPYLPHTQHSNCSLMFIQSYLVPYQRGYQGSHLPCSHFSKAQGVRCHCPHFTDVASEAQTGQEQAQIAQLVRSHLDYLQSDSHPCHE